MRRKRLNHAADTFCQMFRGWRLANSFHGLIELGSGTLVIDAKDATCTFNDAGIASLNIAGELNAWLVADLQANDIPLAAISTAKLTVVLALSTIHGKKRESIVQYISPEGKPIRGGSFHRLAMQCESEITTDEARYTATLSEVVEWPENWP